MAKDLMSHDELIDSIIIDCNTSIRHIIAGNYIEWCRAINDIAQKLISLKHGIADDLAKKNKNIEMLKEQLKNCGMEINDVSVEEFIKKDGADNGAE